MDDTISWRHDSEVLEGGLAPFQESESFGVSDKLKFLVLVLGIGAA
jgi:hypothetical protein